MSDVVERTAVAGPTRPGNPELVLAELRLDAWELAGHLSETARRGQWLDSFLMASGLTQVVEDFLDRRRALLARATALVRGHGLARPAGWAEAATLRVAGCRPRRRRGPDDVGSPGWLMELATDLAGLVLDELGDLGDLGGPGAPTAAAGHRIVERAGATVASMSGWPTALGRSLLRPPSCFTSFDQHPLDICELAARVRARVDPGGGVLVVGVRTSGSYLAPLGAAALRRRAIPSAAVTLRPGQVPAPATYTALSRAGSSGWSVWLIDDPPVSGASLAAAARRIEGCGIPAGRLVVGVATGAGGLPPSLRGWPAVTLPIGQWRIAGALSPERAAAALGMATDNVRAAGVPELTARDHCRARFEIDAADLAGRQRVDVLARGAGPGVFGRRARAVYQALEGKVAPLLAEADGVIYTEEPQPGPPPDPPAMGALVAEHLSDRAARLPADRDRSLDLVGQQAAWEIAGRLLARALGPLGSLTAPWLVHPIVRRLLATGDPSLIDGNPDLSLWRPAGDPPSLVKLDADEGGWSHLDLACYDPVSDLAGAAAGAGDSFEAAARARYGELSGRDIDPERWLLYLLVHLWDRRRRGVLTPLAADRHSGAAVNRYLAGAYTAGLPAAAPPGGRPLAAIDLDGVLEHDALGFPCSTPAGALALRALKSHGFDPVLCSGRSLADVLERCKTFDLPGGVAEYGMVAFWNSGGGWHVKELSTPADRDRLAEARRWLEGRAGVQFDLSYQRAVRAFVDTPGGRRPIDRGLEERMVASVGPGLRVVRGDHQIDVIPDGTDKAAAIVALPRPIPERRVAFAMGDTASDLNMLELADLGLAPGNASAALRSSGVGVLGRSYQAGLSDGVARLIGHRPGSCDTCRAGSLSDAGRLLVRLLGLAEGGVAGMPVRLGRLGLLRISQKWP